MANYLKSAKKDFKIKYSINYLLVLAILGVGLIMYFTGGLKMSYARLFTQIGFSIILAVSLNLVVGFWASLAWDTPDLCVSALISAVRRLWP